MKKSFIVIMLVCFAFMLVGVSALKADNIKAAKSEAVKSETPTVIDKSHKVPEKPDRISYKFGFFFGLKLNIPWTPIVLPFDPCPDNGDDNIIKSSTNPNPDNRISDRGNGDDDGFEEKYK
ncbi:MAG: hypothetical protein GF310_03685 [candidate division Zixibacteria bacterium]|nr:hypothetical protein [candidate division Zixibacteria bacterium]